MLPVRLSYYLVLALLSMMAMLRDGCHKCAVNYTG